MADEKLIFEIGFDLDGAVQVAIKDGKKAITKIQKELGKTPIQLDVDTKSLRAELKKLNDEWNKLSASQRAGVEGTKLRNQYRALTLEANGYTSTLRAAVSAENKATAAKQRAIETSDRQTNAYKTQSTYLSRLVQRMVAYASVAQAFSFIRNIREVTAEFELQRVALGALIQDGYKANAIFEQIKIKAVESPYEIKDLVTYTKQLAAYGVKADDLIGTMNKLADLSAGLGTDMNRIILAYGQIQAAGVLKGTELRQLTELGLPMVDLLAEYYSTLRNEVVSTSEVFDMISNKEIPFQAVQDILNDLTSEGGRFYQMQAKQAETLAGQWSNMKDTLSIMFDEMGRSEEVRSLMESLIDVVKWLALNWREVWQSIKLVGGAYAILKSLTLAQKLYNASLTTTTTGLRRCLLITKEIPQWWQKNNKGLLQNIAFNAKSLLSWKSLSAGIKSARVALKQFSKTLLLTRLSNPIGWIMGIVSAIGIFKVATSEGRDAMDAFREQQREMVKESVENSVLLESNFKRLAKEVVNSVDGSERQRQALRRLKQQYGDIFPEWKLTVEYLQKISEEANGASTAFDAMASSISSFVMEKTRQTLMENYMTQVQNQFKDTFANLTDNIGLNYAEAIGFIVNNFDKYANIDEFINELNKKYAEAMGTTFDGESLVSEYRALQQKYDPKFYDYNLLKNLAIAYFNIDKEVNKLISDFDKLNPTAVESRKRLEDLGESLKEIQSSTGGENAEQVSLNVEKATRTAIRTALLKLSEASGFSIDFDIDLSTEEMIDEIEKRFQGKEVDDILVRELEQIKAMVGLYDDVWKSDLANMRTYLDDGSRLVQAYSSDQIQSFNDLWDAIPEVAKRYKELDEQLGGLKNTYDALNSVPFFKRDFKEIKNYREEISKIEAIMKMLHSFLEKYGGLDLIKEEDTNKDNPNIKKLEDEYAMVEKIYKKYEEFRKFMGDEQARVEVEKYFEGVDLQWLDKAFSTDELKSQAQKALRILMTFGGDTKKVQQNLQFKIGDIDFDDTKRELERKMAKLSEELSRTKTAKEFFDRMLGMTGDRELSATLTMSVYGTTGDDLKSALVKQVEQAFYGVDISDAIDYNTMTINSQKLAEIYAKNQDKILDTNKSMAESIVKDGQKTSASQIEQWAKELEAVKTYADKRIDIARQTQQRISEIEASTLPENEKQRLQEQYRQKEEKDLAKLEYQSFKDSPMYVAMFDNLDSASTTMLNNMRTKLMELKEAWGDLDMPTELKEMQSRLNEIDKQLAARNPFKTLANAYKGYQDLQKYSSRKEAEQDLIDNTEKHAKAVAQLDMFIRNATQAQKHYDDAVKKHGKDSAQAKSYEQLVKVSNALVDGQKETVKTTEIAVEKSQELVNQWKELDDVVGGAWAQADMLTQSIIGLGRGLSDALGGFGSEADAELFDTMLTGFGDLASGITSIGQGIASGNPIAIIQGVTSAISGLANIFSARKVWDANKEIERQQELLDNLSYSYGRLQKSAERAFGTEYIQNYNQQLENLEAQQEAYLAQADAERSKGKKADKDKIKEYEEQARDTADAIKDMYGSLSEHFLGQDLASAARDFASAWIEAYKEFSNTTDAMKAKFQDMIQNMVVESLLAKVMERALEPVFTMIDEMGDGDFYSTSFWQDVMSAMQTAIENGVVGAENVMSMLEQMGINLRGLGGEMTGISRDIATASEESILGLAAGINTQNFYISQVPTKLDTIIGLLRGDGAIPQGSGITLQDVMIAQNQFLSHLPTIAQHTAETVAECRAIVAETRRTADALERVIKPDGTRATYKMNVVTTYQG